MRKFTNIWRGKMSKHEFYTRSEVPDEGRRERLNTRLSESVEMYEAVCRFGALPRKGYNFLKSRILK